MNKHKLIAYIPIALAASLASIVSACNPDFHDEQQKPIKQQAHKEPCCPGICCPDMAGGPVSVPSQQTANVEP